MKTVVLIAPHFFPSFLPSVHRARLWAGHLPEFGWSPIVVTTDPKYYECQVDEELLNLLPEDLRVIRTRALPTRPVRIIGNLGLRSAWWYFDAVRRLKKSERVDFVHITCDSFPAALAGPAIDRLLGIPYGIDYQDPWIPETRQRHAPMSKAWLAQGLSRILEPIALRRARLVTGINERYFASALLRNPGVKERAETAGMPFGSSNRDFDYLAAHPRRPFLFDPDDGNIHLVYAGALLPKAFGVLDRLLEAVSILQARSDLGRRLRIHFVGTGLRENDPVGGHTVKPWSEKWKVANLVHETPNRIKYLDVLNHLRMSTAVLIIGSTEPHYSPSKLYQGILSGKPVFSLLHEKCTALRMLRESNAGDVFSFTEHELPDPVRLAQSLEEFLAAFDYDPSNVNWAAFDGESARESTRIFAESLDRALARDRDARPGKPTHGPAKQ